MTFRIRGEVGIGSRKLRRDRIIWSRAKEEDRAGLLDCGEIVGQVEPHGEKREQLTNLQHG